MPGATQTAGELILALTAGEREAVRFIEAQEKYQAKAQAELEQHRAKRRELEANLAELRGFLRPVVSLEQFIAAKADLTEVVSVMSNLELKLLRSKEDARKAREALPGFALRRRLVLRQSMVVLQFRRPESTTP